MWPQMWTVSTVSSVDFVSVVSSVDQGMCGHRCGLWSQVWTVVTGVDCGECGLFSHLCSTVLYDSLQLLVYELDTSQTWLLEATDLSLHKKLKGHLRDKEGGTRTLQGRGWG